MFLKIVRSEITSYTECDFASVSRSARGSVPPSREDCEHVIAMQRGGEHLQHVQVNSMDDDLFGVYLMNDRGETVDVLVRADGRQRAHADPVPQRADVRESVRA